MAQVTGIPITQRIWSVALSLTLAATVAGCGVASGATAAPTAVPTATTIPTPIPTPTIAPTPMPKPTFFDPLTANKHGWPITPGHCEFANGGYQVKAGLCALRFFYAENGAISVDVKATAGSTMNGYGILFRATQGNFYQFAVVPQGDWVFVVVVKGDGSVVDSKTDLAIKPGFNAVNRLMVTFHRSHFEFFVNGVKVGEYDDRSLTNGVIGVTAGPDGTAVFNNFAYYE